jgi:hypothetical protein
MSEPDEIISGHGEKWNKCEKNCELWKKGGVVDWEKEGDKRGKQEQKRHNVEKKEGYFCARKSKSKNNI